MKTSKSHFKELLHSNQDQIKITFECKNCGCTDFYVLDYQNSSFEILASLYYIKWQYCQNINIILM